MPFCQESWSADPWSMIWEIVAKPAMIKAIASNAIQIDDIAEEGRQLLSAV